MLLQVYISRAAYETVLRKLTKETCPNIKFLNGMVLGVRASSFDKSKIGSVSVRLNGIEAPHNIAAALVVDCTGHTLSAGPKWLERAGFGAPLPGEELGPDQLHIRDIRQVSIVASGLVRPVLIFLFLQSYDPKMHYTSHSVRPYPVLTSPFVADLSVTTVPCPTGATQDAAHPRRIRARWFLVFILFRSQDGQQDRSFDLE